MAQQFRDFRTLLDRSIRLREAREDLDVAISSGSPQDVGASMQRLIVVLGELPLSDQLQVATTLSAGLSGIEAQLRQGIRAEAPGLNP